MIQDTTEIKQKLYRSFYNSQSMKDLTDDIKYTFGSMKVSRSKFSIEFKLTKAILKKNKAIANDVSTLYPVIDNILTNWYRNNADKFTDEELNTICNNIEYMYRLTSLEDMVYILSL